MILDLSRGMSVPKTVGMEGWTVQLNAIEIDGWKVRRDASRIWEISHKCSPEQPHDSIVLLCSSLDVPFHPHPCNLCGVELPPWLFDVAMLAGIYNG